MVNAITIGCSHTQCTYLELKDRWSEIIEPRLGVLFKRIGKNGTGLSHLVLQVRQAIKRHRFEPKNIKYVVVQKPDPIRFPWWETDKSGYRYPRHLSIFEGRKESTFRYIELKKTRKLEVCEHIMEGEKNLLCEIRDLFPDAHCAYYYYWSDYFKNIIHRPILSSINPELGAYAESIGYLNWDFIINPKTIPGIFDDEGDLIWNARAMFKAGWTREKKDTHPSRKYQEIVAKKVSDWVNDLRTSESVQQLLRQAN